SANWFSDFGTAGTVGARYLQAQNLAGAYQYFSTSPINISGYTNIIISFTATHSGNLETSAQGQNDRIRASYRVDGGSWVDFVYDEGNLNASSYTSESFPVPAGSTLEIAIEANNSGGSSTEYYRIDNILVEEPEPPTDTDGDGVPDVVDLDDDNDGIYDSDELANCDPADPVIINTMFFENFGIDTGSSTSTPYTNYTYENGPATDYDSSVNDGEYTIHDDIQSTATWAASIWQNIGDHTTGAIGDGRMAIFNASYSAGEFYRRPLTNVDINAPVDISLWAMNLDIIGSDPALPGEPRERPNITINLEQNGVVIYSFDTGDIPQFTRGDSNAWVNYTGSYTFSSSDPIELVLVNNAPGGSGNDLAIDDILITQSFCDSNGDGVINT